MNNKIIYGIIILCIVFTILIGASVLSTGYKIADFLLALFLSAIGLYLMYKNTYLMLNFLFAIPYLL